MSEEPRFDVEFKSFAVNGKARCYWDTELRRKNMEFIRDIDPEYFYYAAIAHRDHLDGGSGNRAHAAMSIRFSYHHGIETLFALLFAGLQAPGCVVGWIQQYTPEDLRELVGMVGGKPPRYLWLRPEPFTWQGIAETVFSPCYGEWENVEEMVSLFGQFWSRLATEFLAEQHAEEYNSIKHGLRLAPGATGIRVAVQEEEGKPAPFSESAAVVTGKDGSSFYVRNVIAKSEGAQHLSLKRYFINWDPDGLCTDLEIISTCIHNLRTWLLAYNGYREEQLTYKGYRAEAFRERVPVIAVPRGTFEPGLTAEHISEHQFDKKEILDTYDDPPPTTGE